MSVVEISNLAQFFEVIAEARRGHQRTPRGPLSNITFYRGHAVKDWQLEPRLFRENLHSEEQNLVSDVRRLIPQEFAGMSRFQQLAKMQHLGLPTRLLDVTTNPLVALFFACISHPDDDGELIIVPNLVTQNEESWTVEIIMDSLFHTEWGNVKVEDALRRLAHLRPRIDRQLLLTVLENPWTAVLPHHSNPRLTAQSGAFVIAGMKTPDSMEADTWRFLPQPLPQSLGRQLDTLAHPAPDRMRVPAVAKPKLLSELHMIDVTRWSLFPEPEHQIRFIYESYRETRHGSFTRMPSHTVGTPPSA